MTGPLPSSYFDGVYAASDDPWGFTDRWYEQRKYAVTLAALPQARYGSAFEPGCSVGVLSALLAPRCDRLLATDVSERALALATERLAGLPHVRLERRAVPEEWPEGSFDLVLLSELGYYQDRPGLARLLARAAGSLRPGGHLVAVHWRHPVADYPLGGDEVHAAVRALDGLTGLVRHEEEDFLLDVVGRPPAASVARRTGLLA